MTGSKLKVELQRSLQNTRRCRVDGVAEGRATNVPVDCGGAVELGVVEDVENLHAEDQGLRFSDRQPLRNRHIKVIRTRAVEEPPLRIAWGAERIHGEGRGIEIIVVVLARIPAQMEGTSGVIRLIDAAVVDPVWIGPNQ